MRVVVAGAGIGGLAAGIGLRRVGHEVIVLERVEALEAVGAGISLYSNAMEALRRLGIADRVAAVGAPLLRGEIRRPDGRLLQAQDLTAIVDALGQPQGVALHRADLQRALLDAFDGELRTGVAVEGWREEPDGVVVLHSGGELRAHALVGADGIHSALAAKIRGGGAPRYAGYVAWRGLARLDPPYAEGTGLEMAGAGRRFGTIRVGGGLVYWFCTANGPPGSGGDPRELFGGWAEPAPALLAATRPEDLLLNDVIDRPFSDRWGAGRVTLLGDAAHPMTPNMGQGAAQAIEDAVVLAASLRDDPVGDLRRYEERRRARARWFVDTSWRIGRVGQLENPLVVGLRDLAAGLPGAPRFVLPQLRRMLRFPYPDALAP